jgi:hypothetical protein
VEVCQRAFQKVSAIGPTRLTELINMVTNGDLDDGFNIRARKQRKAGTFEPLTEKQNKVFNAINEVKDTLSEAMPHLSIQVKDATGEKVMQPLHFIPAGMFGSQQDIYDHFVKSGKFSQEDVPIRTFREYWNRCLLALCQVSISLLCMFCLLICPLLTAIYVHYLGIFQTFRSRRCCHLPSATHVFFSMTWSSAPRMECWLSIKLLRRSTGTKSPWLGLDSTRERRSVWRCPRLHALFFWMAWTVRRPTRLSLVCG